MKRTRSQRAVRSLAATALLVGIISIASPADAVHDEGFALQGDVDHATQTDWVDLFTTTAGVAAPASSLPAPFVKASFGRDFYAGGDPTTYATGTKDTQPINLAGGGDWQCKSSNNLGPKFDIVNGYAAAMRPASGPATGHLIVNFASEIASPNGDRNAGIWLLKDKDVGCTSAGGNTDWTGHHTDGDIFAVAAFTNGGTKANITVYKWVDSSPTDGNGDIGGSLVLAFSTGDLADARCTQDLSTQSPADSACAIENSSAEVNPPWDAPDGDGGDLNVNEFVEGAVDLTNLGLGGCVSTAVINSRSSQEPGSTLHDFSRFNFETCSNLTVHKYIDADMSGTNNTGDTTTGSDVGGYAMVVKGPAPATTTVCSGATDTTGNLVCTTGTLSNLVPGTYTVTETQKTGFFNTDPGTTPTNTMFNTAATVSKSITTTFANADLPVGNTCYVDTTFQVNSVPSGSGSITVAYSATGPTRATALTGTILLTTSSGTASGTVNDVFNQTDTVAWEWYLTADSANKVTGSSGASLASAGYSTCANTATDTFDNTEVSGTKYKDADGDGTKDAGEAGIAGFVFDLRAGSASGTVLQSATSGANGVYTFASAVPPGSYTVTEQAKTGWAQTEPSSGGRSFTLVLGQATKVVDRFGNTPLSNVTVTFNPLAKLADGTTDATHATSISCVDGASTPASIGSDTDNSLTTGNVHPGQSSLVCTITFVDP
jgi:hypothetical protein